MHAREIDGGRDPGRPGTRYGMRMVVLEFTPGRRQLRRNMEALLATMDRLALSMTAATRNIEAAAELRPRMCRNRTVLQQAYARAVRLGLRSGSKG